MENCVPLTSDAGGVCSNAIVGVGGGAAIIVVTATAELDGDVEPEAAVMVTVLPVGTVAGAM